MSTSSGGKSGRSDSRGKPAFGARLAALDAKLGRRSGSGGSNEKSGSGNALALIPVGVALLLAAVAIPRPTLPRDIPLPQADVRQLDAMIATEHARAVAARRTELPSSVRAVGTAIRTFFTLQANDAESEDLLAAKNAIMQSLATERALAGPEPLLQLRALDTEEFLAEVKKDQRHDGAPGQRERFVSTPELEALAGPFAARMNDVGFLVNGVVQLSNVELRVLYRALWTSAADLTSVPAFAQSLDEERARYALLLRQGRPGEREASRLSRLPRRMALFGADTKLETDEQRCTRTARESLELLAAWQTQKVQEIAVIDKQYPAGLALGILSFEKGEYASAVKYLRGWTEEHPDGPYSLRAANFLRASTKEADAEP